MLKKICVRDGDKILDVGCGDGTLLTELIQWRDAEGYGIDPSEDVIRQAGDAHPELHLETGYSDFLPYDDNTFRIITVCDDFHTFKDIFIGVGTAVVLVAECSKLEIVFGILLGIRILGIYGLLHHFLGVVHISTE